MKKRIWSASILAGLLLGSAPGLLAQQAPNGQANGQYKGPGTPGKMGSTKNPERWAAAVRTADRRADQVRANHGKAKGN